MIITYLLKTCTTNTTILPKPIVPNYLVHGPLGSGLGICDSKFGRDVEVKGRHNPLIAGTGGPQP